MSGQNTGRAAFILVNYNGRKVSRECVASLKRMKNRDWFAVIVDNDSPDGSFAELEKEYASDGQVTVVSAGANLGFAGGTNLGIRTALEQGAEWILLLNNDTEVAEDLLDRMLEGADRESIYAPRINYFSDRGKAWYAAGRIDFNTGTVKNGDPETGGEVSFASGCCMLFSPKVFDKIGEFDEGYFMYYEDVDYCLRARAAGVRIVYLPEAVVYHKVGATSGGEQSKLSIYYNNRNRFFLIRKYRELFTVRCVVYTACTRVLRFCAGVVRRGNDRVIAEAYRDFRKGIFGKKENLGI